MRNIKNRILYKLGKKDAISIAREQGVKIGQQCKILSEPYRTFGSEPYLISIGNHVEISSGCQFITHDGAIWCLRENLEYQDWDIFGRIVIGNNVFIGSNSIILPNVTIGNNCIIGAGSVVTKDIPSNSVWGGVPAKCIESINEYFMKVQEKADSTKGLDPVEKKNVIMSNHPEWFKEV